MGIVGISFPRLRKRYSMSFKNFSSAKSVPETAEPDDKSHNLPANDQPEAKPVKKPTDDAPEPNP